MRTAWLHLSFVLLLAGIAAAPQQQPTASAQGSPEERHVVRIAKSLSHLGWIEEASLLATVRGAALITAEIARITLPSGELRTLERGACASPSPDRSRAAFIPGPGLRSDVWILDLRTGERRQLTTGLPARCAAWSPDGRRIAALVTSQTSRLADDIAIVAADTGQIELLIGAGEFDLDHPAWSPDGQRLAFTVSQSVVASVQPPAWRLVISRIELFDFRDRRRALLLDLLPESVFASDLAYSPDGRTLLFVTGGPWSGSIRGLSGASSATITQGHAPAWHPDGRTLAFARSYDCPPFPCAGDDLYLMRLP